MNDDLGYRATGGETSDYVAQFVKRHECEPAKWNERANKDDLVHSFHAALANVTTRFSPIRNSQNM
jgi:hypothetical protein